MHTTPPSLLKRLRRPDTADAWPRFVKLYTPLLYYWSRRRGLQETDAADVVQDVLLVLFRKLPDFDYDTGKSFRNWLWTITRHKILDRERQLAGRPALAQAVEWSEVADRDDAEADEAEYRRRVLAEGLKQLREEFQATTWRAFEEHGLKGRSATDVAAEVNLSIGAVYAAKFRVLSRLREELQGLLD